MRFPDAEIKEIPIADGGEGTMTLLSELLGAERGEVEVSGPMGAGVVAEYGVAGHTAILEMSAASGLTLVPEGQRDPWKASTIGTGELIKHCLDSGAKKIIVGIGGSATNDGGWGMAEAFGFAGNHDPEGNLVGIVPPSERPGDRAEFVVACDVSNPLLGSNGCTRVYGPQKGIVEADFERHENRLETLANLVQLNVAQVAPETPGAGAAGGLGFGLMAFCGAELRPGFDLLAELAGLEKEIASADLVVTGEGSMDAQTLMGKGPVGVADLARSAGKRVVAFCGVAQDRAALLERFDGITSLEKIASSSEESMSRAAEILEKIASQID